LAARAFPERASAVFHRRTAPIDARTSPPRNDTVFPDRTAPDALLQLVASHTDQRPSPQAGALAGASAVLSTGPSPWGFLLFSYSCRLEISDREFAPAYMRAGPLFSPRLYVSCPTAAQENGLTLVFAQMRIRYDVIQLSLFRALSNPRDCVPLAGLLSPIPRLEAVAQDDRVSHLFAEPFASCTRTAASDNSIMQPKTLALPSGPLVILALSVGGSSLSANGQHFGP
ncbi:hypothetical protein F1880_005620, partial [Penicillium rolfsii]